MAIQPIPPFAPPLPSRTSGTADSEQTEAVAPSAPLEAVAADTSQQTETAEAAARPSRDQIDQAMTEVKRALAPVARNLQFSVDDATGRTVIKVIDSSTNELIRQIPSEELLAITKALDSFSGLFVKQKA